MFCQNSGFKAPGGGAAERLLTGLKFYVNIFGANTKKSGSLLFESGESPLFNELLNVEKSLLDRSEKIITFVW